MSAEQDSQEETRESYLNRDLLDPAGLGLVPVFPSGEPVDPVWITPGIHERVWKQSGGDSDKYLKILADEGLI